jgi:hypothetical protein
MANRTIPVSEANAMIMEYLGYMTEHKVNMQSQTQSAAFTTTGLLDYINTVKDYTDEFRIFFGVYPAGEKIGRMTAIIWPYKGGKPAERPDLGKDGGSTQFDPYNDGGLSP